MQMLLAELYVAVVATTGLGIGFLLQARLRQTHELDTALPSPFKERAAWIGETRHAHA